MLNCLKTVGSLNGCESESAQEVTQLLRDIASLFDRRVQLLNHPADHRTHAFTEHRTATFADRRQFHGLLRWWHWCPTTHTRSPAGGRTGKHFIQFPHQETVRQRSTLHRSCLPALRAVGFRWRIERSEHEPTAVQRADAARVCPTTAIRSPARSRTSKHSKRYDSTRVSCAALHRSYIATRSRCEPCA